MSVGQNMIVDLADKLELNRIKKYLQKQHDLVLLQRHIATFKKVKVYYISSLFNSYTSSKSLAISIAPLAEDLWFFYC